MATVPPFPHEPTRASRLSRGGGGPSTRGLGQWDPGGSAIAGGGGQGGAGGTISRIPPHSFEAEESLLGAMLLSRDAIAVAVEGVGGDDFYRPSHGHIFAAITSLYARGEPADAVTVAEEMRRLGTLDPSGGISTLVSLQANTPAISSVSRYARIVQEHAQLRRLIGTAYEIAEMGYQLPSDVVATLDRAEAMVFEVAQRRSSDSTRALKDLLTESLEHLEYLANRDETITGVATGYHDLDMQLFGLQPSNLVVVGARPSMGKALALDTPIPTPQGWTTYGLGRSRRRGIRRPGPAVHDHLRLPGSSGAQVLPDRVRRRLDRRRRCRPSVAGTRLARVGVGRRAPSPIFWPGSALPLGGT